MHRKLKLALENKLLYCYNRNFSCTPSTFTASTWADWVWNFSIFPHPYAWADRFESNSLGVRSVFHVASHSLTSYSKCAVSYNTSIGIDWKKFCFVWRRYNVCGDYLQHVPHGNPVKYLQTIIHRRLVDAWMPFHLNVIKTKSRKNFRLRNYLKRIHGVQSSGSSVFQF